jgi:RNA ligase
MTQEEQAAALEEIRAAVALYGPDVAEYRNLGNIRATLSPDGAYILLNYTEEATFQRRWSPIEQVCRGLVLHIESTTIVALPFPKFFNLNETEATRLENLPAHERFEVTDKLDGSLGILFKDMRHKVRVVTRGSFVSEQAQWAQAYWDENYGPNLLPQGYTLLFEIIYPENRIVLNYSKDQAGLYLLGARDNRTGHDFSHHDLVDFAKHSGFKLVGVHHLFPDLAHIAGFIPDIKGIEGVVIRFESGLRVKLKTDEYVQLHKLISRLTPKTVLDLLKIGDEAFHAYAIQLPDELQATARRYEQTIKRFTTREFKEALDFVETVRPQLEREWEDETGTALADPRSLKAAFARRAKTYLDPAERAVAFAIYDHKPVRLLLLKQVNLVELFGAEAEADELETIEAA